MRIQPIFLNIKRFLFVVMIVHFVIIFANFFLYGGKAFLLPFPTGTRSFAYELRLRKYLLSDSAWIWKYVVKGNSLVDKPHNFTSDLGDEVTTTEEEKIYLEEMKAEHGECYLDGEYGIWIMTMEMVSIWGDRGIIALHSCNNDSGYFFDQIKVE